MKIDNLIKIRKRKGVSLLEALFVLGIMAIIIGGVMILYSFCTDRYKTSKMFEEIELGKSITASLCGTTPGCTLSSNNYVESGLVPQSFISNNNIVDPWGSNIYFSTGATVYGMQMDSGSGLFFIGSITLHSYYECLQMVEMEKTQMAFKTIGYSFGYQYLETTSGEQSFCENANSSEGFSTYFVLDGNG